METGWRNNILDLKINNTLGFIPPVWIIGLYEDEKEDKKKINGIKRWINME